MYILATIVLVVIVYVRKIYKSLSDPSPLPAIDTQKNWAAVQTTEQEPDANNEPKPFQVQSNAEEIALIKDRIATLVPKLQTPLQGIAFEWGVNTEQFKSFLSFWKDDYLPRWEERVQYLNQFPQYTKRVQGLNIHYIHTKVDPADTKRTVVPLLLLHGWPGSVREFFDVIPRLTKPDAILYNTTFVVVAPSLPGYAWSEAAARPGMGPTEMSIVLRNLMLSLGYERFYVQGGDWGAIIGSSMATVFPENVIGYHSNMLLAGSPMSYIKGYIISWWPKLFVETKHHAFFFPMLVKFFNLIQETGYVHLQASKPDTIGIALTDNPTGLAAYLLEKYLTWTDPNGRSSPDGGWSALNGAYRDGIVDNIMIYIMSGSITTAMRLYGESFAATETGLGMSRVPTSVPTACARFIHDINHSMDWQLQEKYKNLIQSTYHAVGGHFAAMEQPDLLVEDLVEFVRSVNRINKLKAL